MVEEKVEEEKAKKKKRETRKVGGQNSAPTLKLNKFLSQLPKKFIFFFFLFSFLFLFKKNHIMKRKGSYHFFFF